MYETAINGDVNTFLCERNWTVFFRSTFFFLALERWEAWTFLLVYSIAPLCDAICCS
jgi:hypothetical protein